MESRRTHFQQFFQSLVQDEADESPDPSGTKQPFKKKLIRVLTHLSSENKPDYLPNIQTFLKEMRFNLLAYMLAKYDESNLQMIFELAQDSEIEALSSHAQMQ